MSLSRKLRLRLAGGDWNLGYQERGGIKDGGGGGGGGGGDCGVRSMDSYSEACCSTAVVAAAAGVLRPCHCLSLYTCAESALLMSHR